MIKPCNPLPETIPSRQAVLPFALGLSSENCSEKDIFALKKGVSSSLLQAVSDKAVQAMSATATTMQKILNFFITSLTF